MFFDKPKAMGEAPQSLLASPTALSRSSSGSWTASTMPSAKRLFRVDLPRAEDEFLGSLQPDAAGQQVHGCHVRHQPYASERHAEAGAATREDHVGGEGQTEPAAIGGPIHGRDDRLLEIHQTGQPVVQRVNPLSRFPGGAPRRRHGAQVATGTEGAAGPGQHHRRRLRIGADRFDECRQLPAHDLIQRVARGRPGECDDRHAIAPIAAQRLEVHCVSSFLPRRSSGRESRSHH